MGRTVFRSLSFGLGLLLILLVIALGHADPVILETADIGRHIMNGFLTLSQHGIPTTNLYSYTYPDFPAPNHHWASGVIFYLLHSVTGFVGLHALSMILTVTAAGVTASTCLAHGKPWATLAALATVLPLWFQRSEIRPEVFSYLAVAIYLNQIGTGLITKGKIAALAVLQVLWVNVHIYFFLGPLLACVSATTATLFKRQDRTYTWYLVTVTCAASLVNPSGITGLLAPLTIFQNYGYRVLENQNLIFLARILKLPIVPYFLMLATIALSGSLFLALRALKRSSDDRSHDTALALVTIVWTALGILALRNVTLTALILPIVLTRLISSVQYPRILSVGMISLCTAISLPLYGKLTSPRYLGAWPSSGQSLNFFQSQNLKGPIFNNYDIGGMLIFGLFPRERVFVDNRPEAYPASFFIETLVPMQETVSRWQAVDAVYRFNVIYFYRLDQTPWAQTFLLARIDDKEWAPVYVDDLTIIFVRRIAEHQEIIKRHELPRSLFQVQGR